MSDCSLLFPIGTFHTNSFLSQCHPFDCTKVVCFWTLQYFRYVMIVGAIWWRLCTPEATAVDVCSGVNDTTNADVGDATLWPPASAGVRSWPLLTPTTSSSEAVACPSRSCRGRQRRQRNPATAADVGGTTYFLRPLGCWLARADGCPEPTAAQWLRLVRHVDSE